MNNNFQQRMFWKDRQCERQLLVALSEWEKRNYWLPTKTQLNDYLGWYQPKFKRIANKLLKAKLIKSELAEIRIGRKKQVEYVLMPAKSRVD